LKQLILGGVRSGKSRLAEKLALAVNKPVTYIATATAVDGEMQDRIRLHQKNRPSDWALVEEPIALAGVIKIHANPNCCLLIDCLTLWMTNLLCADDETIFRHEIDGFLQELAGANGDIILVSNETGLGVVPMGELSRRFCDETGILHQSVAGLCDRVIMVVAGLPQILKGGQIES
jgi:adenosylcobinamide kinase/adenosylcobinamide-phosphate guanylyltransferase